MKNNSGDATQKSCTNCTGEWRVVVVFSIGEPTQSHANSFQCFAACSVPPSRSQSLTCLNTSPFWTTVPYSIRCPRVQRSLLASEIDPVKLIQCEVQCRYRPYCLVTSSTMKWLAWRCFWSDSFGLVCNA